MIAAERIQDLKALREESDWIAKQLESLQHVVLHVSVPKPQPTERRPLA